MFSPQEHVWFIGFSFYTPCPTCAFLMPCSCIAHNHLMYTPLLALPCLGPYLVFISFPHSSWPFCLFVSKRGRVYQKVYWTRAHSLGRNSIGEMHIPRGRRLFFMRKPCFVLFYSMFVFFFLLYGALSLLVLCFLVLISCLYVGHAYILILLYFIDCMFG